MIPGTHAGYITVEQYENNRARLVANRNLFAGTRYKGRARQGHSLLQGIVLCGRCGRHMNIKYERDGSVLYWCRLRQTSRRCQDVRGRHVERLVEEVVLDTLSKEQLELAVSALEKFAERAHELDRQWSNRLEAARYEAERAARRYHRVEPENRLVARTLEREWNARLEELERVEKDYAEVKRKPPFELSAAQREKILALAKDLPRLWHAGTTHASQRKEVLRLLIEDVTLSNVDVPWSISVAIQWKTGALSRHIAKRPLPHPKTPPEVISRIQAVSEDKTDAEIAALLNAEGYRSGKGNLFTAERVSHVRQRRGLMKRLSRSRHHPNPSR